MINKITKKKNVVNSSRNKYIKTHKKSIKNDISYNNISILSKYFKKNQLNVKYLTNPVCKFVPLFTPDFNNKVDIISTVFF